MDEFGYFSLCDEVEYPSLERRMGEDMVFWQWIRMSRHGVIDEPQPSMLVTEEGIYQGFCDIVKRFEAGALFLVGQMTQDTQ